MGDTKPAEGMLYRPKFKLSKDTSNGTKKQEIWHTHPENLELLALK